MAIMFSSYFSQGFNNVAVQSLSHDDFPFIPIPLLSQRKRFKRNAVQCNYLPLIKVNKNEKKILETNSILNKLTKKNITIYKISQYHKWYYQL